MSEFETAGRIIAEAAPMTGAFLAGAAIGWRTPVNLGAVSYLSRDDRDTRHLFIRFRGDNLREVADTSATGGVALFLALLFKYFEENPGAILSPPKIDHPMLTCCTPELALCLLSGATFGSLLARATGRLTKAEGTIFKRIKRRLELMILEGQPNEAGTGNEAKEVMLVGEDDEAETIHRYGFLIDDNGES